MQRKTVDIDIVIPIVPKDHKFLLRLLREIQCSRCIPTNVIIAASSQSEDSLEEIKNIASKNDFDFQIYIEATEGLRLAGENRNAGWGKATSKYVAFCDADDSYSWNRLYRACKLIEKYSPDLILHSYAFQTPRLWLLFKLGITRLAQTQDFYDATFPNGARNTELEIGEKGLTNLELPSRFGAKARIHHAHAIVRTAVPVRFSSKVRCEDGVFCRDMVYQGFNVIYSNEKLSNYERPTFSNVLSHQCRRLRAPAMKVLSRWVR